MVSNENFLQGFSTDGIKCQQSHQTAADWLQYFRRIVDRPNGKFVYAFIYLLFFTKMRLCFW